MILNRRWSGFLIVVAAWSWLIWPTFLRNIASDERSFVGGSAQPFFLVHLVLTVVSLAIGTAVGVLGVKGWRGSRMPAERRSGTARGHTTFTPTSTR